MTDPIQMRATVVSVLYGPADDGYILMSLQNEFGERVVAAGRAIPNGTQEGNELTITGRWTDGKNGPLFSVQAARASVAQAQVA